MTVMMPWSWNNEAVPSHAVAQPSDGDGEAMETSRDPYLSSMDASGYDSSDETDTSDRVFCRNCTATMFNAWCPACGHHVADDAGLFSAQPSQVIPAAVHGAPLARPVALLWDDRMEQHEEGRINPHPERPDRIRAVMARLQASGLTDHCLRVECPEATQEQLAAVHTPDLVKFVESVALGLPPPESYPIGLLTSDTYVNSTTYQCARLAAGGAAEVAMRVARGEAAHGAAIVRPPGHHAESNMAMGFCFFNNAAVAARAAQAAGANRVLILDWDVHHGNGTQHIFEEDSSVLYMSIHRYDQGTFYPGTGAPEEVGKGPGIGYTVNVAWDGPDLRNGDYICACNHLLVPIAYEFNPDLIIVSAGFDAADGDPIGGCRITPECFAHMTSLLKGVAPLVLLLEGGYNLSATAASTEACLRVLLGDQPPVLPGPRFPSLLGMQGILRSLQVQANYWSCVSNLGQALQGLKPASLSTSVQPATPSCSRLVSIAAPAEVVQGVSKGVPPLVNLAHSARAAAEAKLQQGRQHVLRVRKRQLFQKIRRQAVKAWWQRHNRLVLATQLAKQAAQGMGHDAVEA